MESAVSVYRTPAIAETKEGIMQSIRIASPQTAEVAEVEIPEPGPHEVRVKIEGCGLSAFDVAIWSGSQKTDFPLDPGSPGHEAYGYVDKVGKHVKHLREGDRVTGLFSRALANYDIAKAHEVVKIPNTLRNLPLPGKAIGNAINIFKRCKVRKQHHIAIIGTGFLGSLLTQMVRCTGARVYAISKRPYSLEVAKAMGANESISMEDHNDIEESIRSLTRNHGCDCVIEATGKQESLNLATRLVRSRGRIVIAGHHLEEHRQIDMLTWNKKGIDVINAHENDPKQNIKGIKEAIDSIVDCQLDISPLFTHFFKADQIQEAFETVASRPEGFVKAIVLFD